MQNKINLDTHNEVMPVSEPWHRGSGFTWMLLALAGAVFFLSGAVAKAETVTYTLGDTGYYTKYANGGDIFSNAGGSELGMWANSGSKEVVVWRTLKTAGNNTGSDRSLQVGDTFTITVSATSALGGMGFSLNDNGSTGSYANRVSGSRLFVQEVGTGGSWEVNRSGGYTTLDYNASSTRKDYKFEVALTSESTANVTLTEGSTVKRAFNLSLNGTAGANIDSFSMWLKDDWNGSSNQNLYWKQNTTVENKGEVELGYHLGSNETFTAGKITDGLAANSTSTSSANAVKIGGASGNTVYLSSDNTYTGATTINSDATAEAQHANAFGSTAAGTTISSGGVLKLYGSSGISYAAEALTVSGTGISGAGALRNVGGDNTWQGSVTLNANSRINSDTGSLTLSGGVTGNSNVLYIGGANNTTISSSLSGAGATQDGTTTSLFKDGAGTLTLSGNNSYSGDTRITAGALTVNSGGNLGNGNSDIYISSGATLNVNTSLTVDSVQETGNSNGGVIALGNGATLTIDGASKGTLYQNSISGGGGLTMAGSGDTSLALYGTQSYTGNTTVSGGKISTGVALSTAGVTVSGGVFETSAANILGNSASVSISGTGDYSLGGDDTVGSLAISGGQLSGNSTLTAATYALQGGTVGANLGAGAATASAGTTALNGNLTGSLEATGGTVNAAGTIGGNVTVSGGTVNLSAADRIANGAAVSVSSGTLGMGANNDTVGSFSISGGTLGGTGKLTAATYGLSGGTVNANLGAGTVNANSGTTSLNGSVDATTVNVGGGTLNLGSSGRLAAGTTANVSSGTLSTGGNETITRLNATGGTVNLTGDTLTVTGTGANKSTIGSSATATGGTISIEGELDYQASSGTSALSIASGGKLTGSGTTTGNLTVGAGGILALGNSPGTLTVGSAEWVGGGRYDWEINSAAGIAGGSTGWDLLDVNGLLKIEASSASPFVIALISLTSGNAAGLLADFNETSSYSFAIAYYDTLQAFNSNKFSIDTSGFANSFGGAWSIDTSAGTGAGGQNEVLLKYTGTASAIPEPSSASMLVLGLAAVLAKRRRRG